MILTVWILQKKDPNFIFSMQWSGMKHSENEIAGVENSIKIKCKLIKIFSSYEVKAKGAAI